MHGTPPGPEPTTGRIGLLWGALFIAWMWMLFSGVNWRDMVTRAVHLRQVKKRLRGQDSVLELANAAAWPRDKQALKALIDTLQDYAVQHWAGTWVVVSPRNSAVSHYYQAQGMHPDTQYPPDPYPPDLSGWPDPWISAGPRARRAIACQVILQAGVPTAIGHCGPLAAGGRADADVAHMSSPD